jgi:membrane protease YdiL (CAAX protease family)
VSYGTITAVERRRVAHEVLLVLGVSLGSSAVYSILSLIEKLTRPTPLAHQTTALNSSVVPDRPWLDLTYQLVGIGFTIVPALFALHLLARDRQDVWADLGLDRRRLRFDAGTGLGLAAVIGIPGLGLYVAARALGFNTAVAAANLTHHWWSIPVLVGSAVANAVLEETVVVGYLVTRLRELGLALPWVVGVSAVLRGTYHLYQGFGGFVGNVIMGVVFALFFLRTRRLLPLVIAHTLLDVVAFVGYALLRGHLSYLR